MMSVRSVRATAFTSMFVLLLALQPASSSTTAAQGTTRGNPTCAGEDVFYNPSSGEDIVVPTGYKVEVFARDLNFPTAIAFRGNRNNFRVFVLESGTGLPGRCNNNEEAAFGGKFSVDNPLTPDLVVFDNQGHKIRGPLGKPTADGRGFQPDGPAVGLFFEREGQPLGETAEVDEPAESEQAGAAAERARSRVRLFATDSNQGVRGAPGRGNNTSRISTINPVTGIVTPFITGLPTGDHPTEQPLVKDGWIYWSQGSATNSGVTGHDNGAGGNQHDIACQDITLSNETWDSGDGHQTSGYSNHGVVRPGARVKAFEDATRPGMCTGAILRARLDAPNPADTIQPFSWGYRNPFGIRFAPPEHPLHGGLFVTENGEDERGARPVNNAPDRLQLARQVSEGTPDYHGWPDRFGFLDSTQSVFDPIGGPGDDLPTPRVLAEDRPVRHVLAFPPQSPVAPLAIEPANVAVVGTDFVPDSFTGGVVRRGAALAAREGDFGFSPGNGEPEEGHDIQLVNFREPLTLELSRFAFNCPQAKQAHQPDGTAACTADQDDMEQAFVSQLRGINRPVTVLFGPDGALYLVDYGAVRDFGQSEPRAKFKVDADSPLVQIPHTGVIWKISRIEGNDGRSQR